MRPADPLANGRRFIAGLFREHGRRLLLLFLCLLAPLWLFVELADEVHELEDFYFDDALLWQAHAMAGPALDRRGCGRCVRDRSICYPCDHAHQRGGMRMAPSSRMAWPLK